MYKYNMDFLLVMCHDIKKSSFETQNEKNKRDYAAQMWCNNVYQ